MIRLSKDSVHIVEKRERFNRSTVTNPDNGGILYINNTGRSVRSDDYSTPISSIQQISDSRDTHHWHIICDSITADNRATLHGIALNHVVDLL